jgi:hypothetical protein
LALIFKYFHRHSFSSMLSTLKCSIKFCF